MLAAYTASHSHLLHCPRGLLRPIWLRGVARSYAASGHRFIHDAKATRNVVFSGIQPTGIPHLGNYLGALKQWVEIQDEAPPTTDLIFSIVDLHALTMPQERDRIRQWRWQTLAALLAIGLNPNRSTIFFQSAVNLR